MSSSSTTGDLNNNLEKVLTELKSTCVQVEQLDLDRLRSGKPDTILPILHAILLDNSRHIARLLSSRGYTLYSTNDQKFIQVVFRILRNEFCYRPSLTTEQFLSKSFAERKLIFLFDVIKLCKRKCEELERNTKESKRSKWRPTDKAEPAHFGTIEPPRVQVVEEANSSVSYSSSPLHGSPQTGEEGSSVAGGVKEQQGVAALSRSQRQQPVKAYDQGIQQRRSNSLPGAASATATTPNVSLASSTGSIERSADRLLERSMECWVTSPPPLSVDRSKKKDTAMLHRTCWTLPASPRRKLAVGAAAYDNESDSEICSASYSEIGSPPNASTRPSTSASAVQKASSAPTTANANSSNPNPTITAVSPSEQLQDYRIPSSKIARKLMLSGPGPIAPKGSSRGLKDVGLPHKRPGVVKSASKKVGALQMGINNGSKASLSGSNGGNVDALIETKLEPLKSQFVAVVSALEQLSELPARMDRMEASMKSAIENLGSRVSALDAKLQQIGELAERTDTSKTEIPSGNDEHESVRTKERPSLKTAEQRRRKGGIVSTSGSGAGTSSASVEANKAEVESCAVLKEKNPNATTDDFITGIEKRYKKTAQFIKAFDDLT